MILKKLLSNIQKHSFKESSETLHFIDKGVYTKFENRVSVILSPAFYWVRKEKLPVKKISQAKKLLPAIFDGTLPDGIYTYSAEATEDEGWFYIYAYDEDKIVKELESLNIGIDKIKNIYFAQSYAKLIKKPVDIGNGNMLVNDNGILCRLPVSLAEETSTIDQFLKDALKYKALSIHISKRMPFSADPSMILKISAAIFILAIIYGIEYTLYLKTLNDLVSKNESLVESYNIPKTSYQRKARIKKLESIKEDIISKREIFAKLFRVPIERKSEFIRKIDLSGKHLSLEIVLSNNQHAEKIKQYLEKFLNLKSIKVTSHIMKIKAEI